jgi:hypothetical protein
MKNQFFGDKRDYFKYALLEAMMEGIPSLRQLTCVWMLTEGRPNRHGNQKLVPVHRSEALADFLTDRRNQGRLDVREIGVYFSGRPYAFNSYGDDPSRPFGASRDRYFGGIPAGWCRSALVFVDPDNGLEPAGRPTSAHITANELGGLYVRLLPPSLVVMYQHLPRRSPSVFWPETAERLRSKLGCRISYISEGDFAFFLAPNGDDLESQVDRVLGSLAYPEALPRRTRQRVVGHSGAI